MSQRHDLVLFLTTRLLKREVFRYRGENLSPLKSAKRVSCIKVPRGLVAGGDQRVVKELISHELCSLYLNMEHVLSGILFEQYFSVIKVLESIS